MLLALAGLLLVSGTTVAVLRLDGVALGLLPVRALLRATLQLSVVALVLRGVLAAPLTVLAFVALMLLTASITSGGRLRELRHGRRLATLAIVVGAGPAIGLVLALRLVPLEPRYVVAVGGILVGNAMSASTLAGRGFLRTTRVRSGEIEGWLALGATPVEAHRDIGREAVRDAVVPSFDQTRSTGLVTLPGAFVGALFGGASPVEAAQFQLVVLAGIGLAMSITAVTLTRLAGRNPQLPAALSGPGGA
ncbi:ABC transporter permease [Nocardioides sp. CBS4Y-1]|uniref:ABC transporter permease n=1 Tax=Nocardioides acrostichi TaxID=2784339 RepID=A0A930YDT3_9ACTN|nr:ABC transporter permease [Nocardioides acrostichi]